MNTYLVREENMERLEKKLATIEKKCKAAKCSFTFDIADEPIFKEAEDNEGNKFGANKITISSEESPYKEDVIWEDKPFNVTWDTPFKEFKNNWKDYLKVGTILRVYVSKTGNDNGQGCAATSWWTNIVTGGKDGNRGDTIITGDDVLTFVISQSSIDLLTEQEGLYIVGNGYTIKKITIE